MGATPSSARQKALVREVERWPGFQEHTCLTNADLNIIAGVYLKALKPDESELARCDFTHWLEMSEQTTGAENRVFEIFSVDDNKVGIHAFMVSLWNYCVDGKDRLSRLAFDIYDRHTSGAIMEADLEGMLIDVWGVNCFRPVKETENESDRLKKKLREADQQAKALMAERVGADPMTIEHWESFCRAYPNLLHPIFKIQRMLQDRTLGLKRWAKVGERVRARAKTREAEILARLRATMSEEERQKILRQIEKERLVGRNIVGSKCERLAAAREILETGGDGLPPSLAFRSAVKGNSNSSAKAIDVRERLKAARERTDALADEAMDWEQRASRADVQEEVQPLPKFDHLESNKTLARVRDFNAQSDETWEYGRKEEHRGVSTPGSIGSMRVPLGAVAGGEMPPTLLDAGIIAKKPPDCPSSSQASRYGSNEDILSAVGATCAGRAAAGYSFTATSASQSPSARRSSTLTVPTKRTVGIADLSGCSVGIAAVEARRQSRITAGRPKNLQRTSSGRKASTASSSTSSPRGSTVADDRRRKISSVSVSPRRASTIAAQTGGELGRKPSAANMSAEQRRSTAVEQQTRRKSVMVAEECPVATASVRRTISKSVVVAGS